MAWKLQENVVGQDEIKLLVDFISSGERLTQGAKIREFEAAWSAWQGCNYSVFVNSGSSANLLIMNLMKEFRGWRDGDEVIVPAVTWVTNISPVFQCGLKPIFVDVNLGDFSFDYDKLASKITDRTRAIFVTHLIGFPADIPRIKKIIGNRKIDIMEDCCESHGAKVDGVKIGNLGVVSSFSSYWGHHMTTVEGGFICTNDEDIYKLAIIKRSHGLARELPERYQAEVKKKYPDMDFNFLFLTDGFNFRNTEMYAVLGLSQVKQLDRSIAIRNENYKKFLEIIKPYEKFLLIPNKEGMSSFCFPFILKDAAQKKPLQEMFDRAEVESRPVISGNLMRQPFLKAYLNPADTFPNAEIIHQNGFYIGNNQFVDAERLDMLKKLLADFFSAAKTA